MIPITQFLTARESMPVIDVRSPSEFAEGHIPGAINLPLFSDKERAAVGTTYKQQGRWPAIDQGLELVGPRMSSIANEARAIANSNSGESATLRLAVYCWRGGMRSQNMTWLFETAEIDCQVLKGGYKAYREFARDYVDQLKQIHVLAGPTGAGKTELLSELRNRGEQTIDLEAIANHRGSSFGGIGQKSQPTTEYFQSLVFEALYQLDPSREIWVEGESKSIGRVFLPEKFFARMERAKTTYVDVDRDVRIKRILDEYGSLSIDQLKEAVCRIEKRLGLQRKDQCLRLLDENQLEATVEILLDYYDKAYKKSSVQLRNTSTDSCQTIKLPGAKVGDWADILLANKTRLELQS